MCVFNMLHILLPHYILSWHSNELRSSLLRSYAWMIGKDTLNVKKLKKLKGDVVT